MPAECFGFALGIQKEKKYTKRDDIKSQKMNEFLVWKTAIRKTFYFSTYNSNFVINRTIDLPVSRFSVIRFFVQISVQFGWRNAEIVVFFAVKTEHR